MVEGGGLENQAGNSSFFPLNRLADRCCLVLPTVWAILWQKLWQESPDRSSAFRVRLYVGVPYATDS